jgi:hypothetical protein
VVRRCHEAFDLRASHIADALEDSELIEFTVAADYRRKAEHVHSGVSS